MLVLVRSFSYTPHTSFSEVLIYSDPGGRFSEEFIWSLHASFSEEFLLHSPF